MVNIFDVEIKTKRITDKQKRLANHKNNNSKDYSTVVTHLPYIKYFIS